MGSGMDLNKNDRRQQTKVSGYGKKMMTQSPHSFRNIKLCHRK